MKLEAGKRYVTRDGRITGPITQSNLIEGFPFSATMTGDGITYIRTWDKLGSVAYGLDNPCDLVSEYVEPTEPTEQASEPRPKIIQLLLTPNDDPWLGRLLGLSDDGVVYEEHLGVWTEFVPKI